MPAMMEARKHTQKGEATKARGLVDGHLLQQGAGEEHSLSGIVALCHPELAANVRRLNDLLGGAGSMQTNKLPVSDMAMCVPPTARELARQNLFANAQELGYLVDGAAEDLYDSTVLDRWCDRYLLDGAGVLAMATAECKAC